MHSQSPISRPGFSHVAWYVVSLSTWYNTRRPRDRNELCALLGYWGAVCALLPTSESKGVSKLEWVDCNSTESWETQFTSHRKGVSHMACYIWNKATAKIPVDWDSSLIYTSYIILKPVQDLAKQFRSLTVWLL